MKTFVPFKQSILKFVLLGLLFAPGLLSQAQSSHELTFNNSTLQSGTGGADNDVYLFPLVKSLTDAHVKITGRSSVLVTLSDIDLTIYGFDKAFQPQVMYNGGSTGGPSDWWIEFEIKFMQTGTSIPVTLDSVYSTGLDVDGDDGTLKEFNSFYMSSSYTLENPSLLTVSNMTGTIAQPAAAGKKFDGTTILHPAIDTIAKDLMTTNLYKNVTTITVRVGASVTGSSVNTSRLHSLWFRNFAYSSPVIILPVKLIAFTATLNNNNKADLKWTTAGEINVSHFVIERSADGVNYNVAGKVFANGNTTGIMNYSFTDAVENTQSPVIYYRLRSMDIDGKAEYSETRIIRLHNLHRNNITVFTYPNPVSNELRITIPDSWQNKQVQYEVLSINGYSAKKSANAGSSQTETMNISNLTPGLYIVKATCNGETAQQKIIKN
jgi:hypothetical protein